ncbi:simple sugar transport system permease protein [Nesterenkonia jeotgali]|uniref:Simple sugar transport system permease protein n=2 Tax=Nesterenkonia jeotgali TaxID=317018 RepID=A0A839FQN3_9MICC|nr:ABC transporter permease [Nesterenkonia jeotgali]MBA8921869.1 simple sugar transport system permease protein [Nesterenkonia jeotgali]
MSATGPQTGMTPAPKPEQQSPWAEAEGRLSRALRELGQTSWVVTVLAVVVALVVGAVLILAASRDVQASLSYFFAQPSAFLETSFQVLREAYSALFRGAVFDWQAPSVARSIRPLTETMVYSVPLILAGLGIAIGFRSGMLNIGGQGQIILGATSAGFLGYALSMPVGLHVLLALAGGILGGAIWGGIAGVLKARTGANEVIVTIMLNNIAIYLLAYLLQQQWFKQTGSNQPLSSSVDESAQLFSLLGPGFRLHAGFLVAILATIAVWWLLERSTLGFEFRAIGENPEAARTAGINVPKATALVLVIAGGLAGLGGAAHVLGTEYRLAGGVAGTLGFDAITVALLGRSKPLGTFLAGLLLGGLRAGGVLMQAQTGTPIDIVLVLQAVIVLMIAAPPLVRAIFFLPHADGRPRIGRRRARSKTPREHAAAETPERELQTAGAPSAPPGTAASDTDTSGPEAPNPGSSSSNPQEPGK